MLPPSGGNLLGPHRQGLPIPMALLGLWHEVGPEAAHLGSVDPMTSWPQTLQKPLNSLEFRSKSVVFSVDSSSSLAPRLPVRKPPAHEGVHRCARELRHALVQSAARPPNVVLRVEALRAQQPSAPQLWVVPSRRQHHAKLLHVPPVPRAIELAFGGLGL